MTPIYLSAFLIGKRLSGLKQTLIQSSVQLIFAEQNIEELKIVTSRPKFEKYFKKNDVNDLIDLIYTIGVVEEIPEEPQVCRDSKDNFLLALSEKSKADYLVTGDSDLLIIGKYKNTQIISIEQLEKILKRSITS